MSNLLFRASKLMPILLLFLSFSKTKATTEKYRLSLRDDPSSTIVIGWNQVSGANATVYYGTIDHGTNIGLYSNLKTVDRSQSWKGMNNRFARLTGLTPNTVYYFVVTDADGSSARMSFRTLPNVPTEKLSIIAGGDSRNNRVPRRNANTLVAKLRPHAVMFGGDYTSGNSDSEWSDWFDDWQYTIAADGRMTQLIATRGNHESSNSDVYNLFDVPSTDVYYALTLGGSLLRVYTLNTETSIAGNQTTWLLNDLIASQGAATWKFAQYHKPMRPHTASKSEGNTQYNSWSGLFNTYNVKLVVECDAHTVKTTWPVVPSNTSGSDEGFIRDDVNGTVYVGEGCWGAPLRSNNDDKNWTRNSGQFNHVNWIFIDQNNVEARKIEVDNSTSSGVNTDATRFATPNGLSIWNPSNGSVITIPAVSNNIVPTVSLTSPVDGTIYQSPQQVTITASAADSDGTISSVEFYQNGSLISVVGSSPFSVNWIIPSNGSYSITAKALDNDGGVAYSSAVAIASGSNFTFSKRITSGDDDVEEEDDGTMYSNSSDIELVADGGRGNQTIGLRYTGVTIPNGATINNAYIQFTCDETNSGGTSLTFKGEDEDNASAYSSSNGNVSGRTTTTAAVGWNPSAWTSIGTASNNERSPDLKTIVSEITSRVGWSSGNAMSFVITGTGERTAEAYEGSSSAAPQLVIDYTLAGTPNIDPTINITSPAHNSSYATLATINIDATTADSDGTIDRVDFYADGTLIGFDNSPPYSLIWTIPAFAAYAISAVTFDNDGGTATDSIEIVAAGNPPPVVAITSPSNGANYASLSNINIAATAVDTDGVQSVTFYRDGILIGTDNTAPYDVNWSIPAYASYVITAEAQDSLGATATTSIQISATALPNIPPTTSVVNPVDGDAYLTPQTIVISANAADSDGSIASVEFYQNNNLIGTVGSSPYSLSWTIPSMGSFQLATRAIDDVGDAVYSTPVNIVVGNNFTVSKRISNGDDDVEEGVNGTVYTNSSELELVYDSFNSQGDQTVGLRFRDITVPNGAIITNAYVQFTAGDIGSGPMSLSFSGHASDNSPIFTGVNNGVSSRSLTAASVAWSPVSWNFVGQSAADQKTPDLTSVISEIVSRPGWISGNALTLVVTGTGVRTAEAYNGSPSLAPEIVIEYTLTAPNVLPAVTLTSPANGALYTSLATIALNANASDSDGSIAKVNFYQNGIFVGSDNSAPFSLSWTIPAYGAYAISAEAVDNDGGSVTDVVNVNVVPPNLAPFAVISGVPSIGFAPLIVNADASLSYDTDGNVASYAWDFGDGNSSTVSNPTHVYYAQGTYIVTLKVTDNDGAVNIVSTVVSVMPVNVMPIPNFTVSSTSGQSPHPVAFDATASFDGDGSIVDYAWDFGDGSTTNGPSGTHATHSHTYTIGGIFTAQLTLTDNLGGTASALHNITVSSSNVSPTAVIATSAQVNGKSPHSVAFMGNTSSDPDGTIASYAWDFGDGNTASTAVTTHIYTAGLAGNTYTATLTVTDDQGAIDTESIVISVSAPNMASVFNGSLGYTAGSLNLWIDEDLISNSERNHTTEPVTYFAIAASDSKSQNGEISSNVPARVEVTSKIYPNPTRDNFVVEFNQNVGDFIKVSIADMRGRSLISNKKIKMENKTSIEISVINFSRGQYYVLLQTDGGLIRLPLIVVN